MEFRILGPLEVLDGERRLPLGGAKRRAVVALLLLDANGVVPTERLIDGVWGDDPPAAALGSLQNHVLRLRRELGERLVTRAPGYLLRVEPGELDLDRFGRLVEEARACEPAQAASLLREALALWRGPPLADLSDEPVAAGAAYLAELRLEAVEQRIDADLALGRHSELVPELEELIAAHPYREHLHAQLMLAFYRCGRQAEALETGRALQLRLRAELGIEPGTAIRDRYRDILLQARHLALEPPQPPSNLPSPPTSFVGRKGELREVAELLDGSRLVTLTGPAGIGKTRLAIEAARQLRSRFAGGVWWVDLAALTDPGTVVDELAGVLGLSPAPGVDLVDAVTTALGRREALLLIDNCEQVASAAGRLVAAILRETAGPRVLATSRTPLFVEGERLWNVPPLSLPVEGAAVSALSRSDAVRLFVERGRAVDPSFALDGGNSGAVVEVCRRLDGVSLAIEMAAARLSTLSPRKIAQHLGDRFALLQQSPVGTRSRYRTLEAAFDASYVLLSERERAVFERLSVFSGPFELEAAAAVAGIDGARPSRVRPVIGTLVEASMLTVARDGQQTRYRLLESLREYAAAHLREHGREDEARRAHARYYLDLAAQAGAVAWTPDFAPWMRRLTSSYGELRQALAWSLAHEERTVTLRAAPALVQFWYRRGDGPEAGRWASRMLEGDLGAVPAVLLAATHTAASFATTLAVDLEASGRHAEEAARLARECDAARALAFALWASSNVALGVGDMRSARRFAIEALETCKRRADRWSAAGPLTVLGFTSLFGGGSLEEARRRFEQALPLYRELGDLGGLAVMALSPLISVALRQHDLEGAERYATECMELARGTGWEAAALVSYGLVLIAQGDLEGAEAAELRGLEVSLQAGLENWFRPALRELARVAAERGQLEVAATLFGASRRNLPAYFVDPALTGPVEERCRGALGDKRFEQLAQRGDAMSHDELMALAEGLPGSLATSVSQMR